MNRSPTSSLPRALRYSGSPPTQATGHPEEREARIEGRGGGLERSGWFDWLTMRDIHSAHPEFVEGLNGWNDWNL